MDWTLGDSRRGAMAIVLGGGADATLSFATFTTLGAALLVTLPKKRPARFALLVAVLGATFFAVLGGWVRVLGEGLGAATVDSLPLTFGATVLGAALFASRLALPKKRLANLAICGGFVGFWAFFDCRIRR